MLVGPLPVHPNISKESRDCYSYALTR